MRLYRASLLALILIVAPWTAQAALPAAVNADIGPIGNSIGDSAEVRFCQL